MKKMVDGVVMDMTAEEIAEVEKNSEKDQAMREQFQANRKAHEDLKASAKAKLIAGEKLTEEEANILVGV
jgi:hypothetical protein